MRTERAHQTLRHDPDHRRIDQVGRNPEVEQARDSRRRIVGVVGLRTLLFAEDLDPKKTAGDFLKPALFLDQEMRLEVALRHMQRTGQRLAIVLGRDRAELGVISLQDILQVIFGEVRL